MGQINQTNNFIIYNISLHYDVQFYVSFLAIFKFLITNVLVSKFSLPCPFHSFLQKRTTCLFDGRHG
jgi:hypothetical protein